jgi:DNA-binding MarR family transcriptional regulator
LTSPGKARHVLRVYHARRGTTELIFEDRTLARVLHRVLARADGIYGATLLEQFGGDGQDLGRALKMLVTAGLLRRSTDPAARTPPATSRA